MKKILSLLVSGLILLCMAGSAMATSVDFPGATWNNAGQAIIYVPSTSTSSNPANQAMTVVVNPGGAYAMSVSTDKSDLYAAVRNLNGESTGFGSTSEASHTFSNLVANQNYNCQLSVYGKAPGIITINFSGPNGTKSQQVIVTAEARIPEFPTVAAPVAAVLGLFFIIGRKKEGL